MKTLGQLHMLLLWLLTASSSSSSTRAPPPPESFVSSIVEALPGATFVYQVVDDDIDDSSDLLLADGVFTPDGTNLHWWSEVLSAAELRPMLLPEQILEGLDRSRLKLSSQMFAWKINSGRDAIEVTEHYAVKGSPFQLFFASWSPSGGLVPGELCFPVDRRCVEE